MQNGLSRLDLLVLAIVSSVSVSSPFELMMTVSIKTMYFWRGLFILVSSLVIVCPKQAMCLRCWTTQQTPEQCQPGSVCISSLHIDFGTMESSVHFAQCGNAKIEECNSSRCDLESATGGIYSCCCSSDLCNIIDGLAGTAVAPPTPSTNYTHPCDSLGCNQACAIIDGVPSCLCKQGYKWNGTTCLGTGLVCFKGVTDNEVEYCNDLDFATVLHPDFVIECTTVLRIDLVPQLSGCNLVDRKKQCQSSSNTCDLKLINNHFICCCTTNLCNNNITYPVPLTTLPITSTTSITTSHPTVVVTVSSSPTAVVAVVAVVIVPFVLVLACIVVSLLCYWKRCCSLPTRRLDSEVGDSSICLAEQIGWGRNLVYAGQTSDNKRVAVKVFPTREHLEKEQRIFELPNLTHENILCRLSYKPINNLWLVSEFHPRGSVHAVLKNTIISVEQFCMMAKTTAAGIAHLHKIGVTHRDIKPPNILLKNNAGVCCICDFEFADVLYPMKDSLHRQVGTHTYMSPELLQNHVTCTVTGYLAIDQYALSITLCEMLTRTVIDENESLPEYRPPFYEYGLSPNPTIKEVHDLVCTRRLRPVIPERFKEDSRFDKIVEILTYTWNDDPQSRMSAALIKNSIISFESNYSNSNVSLSVRVEIETTV